MKKVIISIPAYNEADALPRVIDNIKGIMKSQNYRSEIIVVDDGSTDGTAAIAKKYGAKIYSHPKNYGLAETFRTELKQFLKSDADIFVHIDADGQYNAKDIPRLINEIEKGADLVLGNRFLGGIESMPWIKRLGNKAFSRTISKIIKYKIGDAQTGFRAFTREVAKIPITSTHTYTQEQIIRAVKEKCKVVEVPVYFAKRGDESRLIRNPFEYAMKAWINILRIYRDYEPLKFFGRIGFFFLVFGTLIGAWLIYILITTGRIGHIPLTIFTILLIMLGVQIIIFGFLADMRK